MSGKTEAISSKSALADFEARMMRIVSLGGRYRLGEEEEVDLAEAAREITEVEWEEVAERADDRWLGGLLCHHLRSVGIEPVEALQGFYRKTAIANVGSEGELRRVGAALSETGISILLIKGTALKPVLYPNPGLRPSEDSDWALRSSHDREIAVRALEENGFEAAGEAHDDFWVREALTIELHENVLGDDRVRARSQAMGGGGIERINSEVWARAQPSPLGSSYLIPSPEDHLIILCAHLMKHNFEPGIWLTDIEGLLVCHRDLDWDAVLTRAREWGLIRPLSYAFRCMRALEEDGAVRLPGHVREALSSVQPTALDRLLLSMAGRGLTLAGEKQEWQRPPVANLLWLSSQKGVWAKAVLIWEAMFPRDEVMKEIYAGYRPFYRGWFMFVRLLNLVRLGLRVMIRMFRG